MVSFKFGERLELEGEGLLPGEVLVGEVTVLGGLEVLGLFSLVTFPSHIVDKSTHLLERELTNNNTRPEVEVVLDDLNELIGALLGGTVRLNKDG